jgi:hypothetical protein
MYDKGLEQGTWRYYAVLEGEEVQNGEETWKLVLTSQCQSHIDDLSTGTLHTIHVYKEKSCNQFKNRNCKTYHL